jgi:predicted phosphodiesterase
MPAPVVIFGHTHHPVVVPLRAGASYVNTGTWAPVWSRGEEPVLLPGRRNVLEVRVDDGKATVSLRSCLP